jgi:hypothetical protein
MIRKSPDLSERIRVRIIKNHAQNQSREKR